MKTTSEEILQKHYEKAILLLKQVRIYIDNAPLLKADIEKFVERDWLQEYAEAKQPTEYSEEDVRNAIQDARMCSKSDDYLGRDVDIEFLFTEDEIIKDLKL